MPAETGNQIRAAFIQELIPKTTPSNPAGQVLRKTAFTLSDSEAAIIANPELRRDRQKAPGRRGARIGKGELSGVLSYGTYDAFMAAALGCHAWTTNVVKVKVPISTGAISLAVAATAKTFTRATGSFVTDGFAVGDVIKVEGCTNAANNGTFVISNVAALVLTCSTATGLVDETSASGRVIETSVLPSFTFERQHLNNGFYFPFRGTVVTSFEISGKANANVEVKFGLLSPSVGDEARTSLFSTIVEAGGEEISTTWTGSVKKDGTAITTLTGWSLKVDPSITETPLCGTEEPCVTPGTVAISGSLEMIFDSYELYTAYRQETKVSFQTNVTTEDGSYACDVTNARITKFGAPSTNDGLTTVTVEYEGYTDATNTALKITRAAA